MACERETLKQRKCLGEKVEVSLGGDGFVVSNSSSMSSRSDLAGRESWIDR